MKIDEFDVAVINVKDCKVVIAELFELVDKVMEDGKARVFSNNSLQLGRMSKKSSVLYEKSKV